MFEVMQTCGNNSIFEMMSVYNIRLPWIIVCMESILPDIQVICLNFLQECSLIWCHEFISSVLDWSTNPSISKKPAYYVESPYFGILLVVIGGETDRTDTWQQPHKIIKPCTLYNCLYKGQQWFQYVGKALEKKSYSYAFSFHECKRNSWEISAQCIYACLYMIF